MRPRILLVVPELPHEPLTGAHTRPLSVLRALAQRYRVTVVGAAPPGAELAAIRELGADARVVRSAAYERSSTGAALARLRRWATPVPLLSRSRFVAMAEAVQRAVAENRPDAIHLFNMYSVWYTQPGIPCVIDLPDVVSGLCEAAAAAGPWRYALARLQRREAEVIERRELPRMAAVLAINRDDATRLRRLGVTAAVVPLAVELPQQAGGAPDGGATSAGAPLELLFVGDFNHHPNRAAAGFIAHELAPALRRAGVRARVTIAGRAADLLPAHAAPASGITYLADVPDLAPLYRTTDAVVVPMPFGGGTKNKTLEAMAWGKPVIGTPQAFTGVEAPEGAAYVCVPLDAPIMADAVKRLAADGALRAAVGQAGREYVARHHAQVLVDEAVWAVYERVLGSGSGGV